MLEKIGIWSSIIGLIISLLTLFYAIFINKKVKNIKRRVMFNTRVSPLLRDLKTYTRNFNALYVDFDNNLNDLKVEITKCRVQLESVVPKLPKTQNVEFKKLIIDLKKAQKANLGPRPDGYKRKWYKKKVVYKSKENIWELYVALTACINKLQNLINDKTII